MGQAACWTRYECVVDGAQIACLFNPRTGWSVYSAKAHLPGEGAHRVWVVYTPRPDELNPGFAAPLYRNGAVVIAHSAQLAAALRNLPGGDRAAVLVEQVVALEAREERVAFGDSLPAGLKLVLDDERPSEQPVE